MIISFLLFESDIHINKDKILIYLAVCDFRLDFDTFTTNGPSDTSETGGGACQDILTTTTVSNKTIIITFLL